MVRQTTQALDAESLQIFVRYAGRDSSLALLADPWETVWSMKERLLGRLDAAGSCKDMWVAHAGRACLDEASLATAGVREGSSLELCARVRGGGGDGGSTGAESRSSFLEMYARKKPAKANPLEDKLARWTTCQLSGERLAPPVVADELGHLYNKDAVVGALIAKALPPGLAHISSLRHLIDLRLARNPNYAGQSAASAADFQPGNGADWACPVTGLVLNGRYRFAVLRGTGLVVSEKALKEVPAAVEELVGGAWSPTDVLPLNGSTEEAGEVVPMHATKDIWASIFTSSRPEVKETYGCRALSSRGL
ncbi:hypothetical protein WJX81_001680 [Elliptochloris bilobata]|uniref:Ubiquitin-like domain-containing protein n=1 Tax=Elliptochloris bilobata TaxID=381761 RepID=A0AAW1SJN4_9CHLO